MSGWTDVDGRDDQPRASSAAVRLTTYRCAAEHGRACPQRPPCCPQSTTGRTISRTEHESLLEELRQRLATPEAKALYRMRRQTVELVNADWKQHRRLRRLCSRGRERARCQVGLQVLVHNLVSLVAEEGRRAAGTSATRLPARTPLPIIT